MTAPAARQSWLSEAPGTPIWPLTALSANPLNPRTPDANDPDLRDLILSVTAKGILQPLTIRPDGVLIAGHRRLVAARAAGLTHVPVYIRDDLDEADQLEAMLVENLHRRGLNPMETATGCQRLRERGRTLEQIAMKTIMSPDAVRKHLALLTLPVVLQGRCVAGELPLGWVLDLARLPDPETQVRVALDAISAGLTAEQLRRVVNKVLGPPPRKYPVVRENPLPEKPERVIQLFAELTTAFQRTPALVQDLVVQDWAKRLSAAMRAAQEK